MSNLRRYTNDELDVRVRGDGEHYGVHIEHKSGAALIVPSCAVAPDLDGVVLRVTGFDGTSFDLKIDDQWIEVSSSTATPILGGLLTARIPRGAEPEPAALRVTGDEETMPIKVLE